MHEPDAHERDRLIQAYHDGELDAQQRRRVETLLGNDEAARRALEAWRDLSALLADAPRPLVPQHVSQAAHDAADRQVSDAVLRRIGVWSTAAAAAILIVAGLGLLLLGGEAESSGETDPIARALAMMNQTTQDAPSSEDPAAALSTWILESLDTADTPAQEPQS